MLDGHSLPFERMIGAMKRRGLGSIVGAAAFLAVAAAPAMSAEPVGDAAASMYEPSTVDVIYLTLSPQAEGELEAEPDEYVEGTFSLAETNGTPGGIGPASTPITVGIRLKGGVGSGRTLAQKAAFKIKFSWVKGQKFRGLKKLTLNNMVQDPSAIHETLAYKAFRSVGVAAPRTGYAYVYVNGSRDYGLHVNVETLDAVALEKRFGPFQHLYEGAYGVDVETGPADTAPEVAAAAGEFEVDEGDEGDRSDLEALIQSVNSPVAGDWSDRVEGLADLKEMTRMWGVEKYIGHSDGYSGVEGSAWPNNYYLLSDPAGRFQMLPWGTDQTWEGHLAFVGDAGVLFDRCLADASCAAMYRKSLREMQAPIAAAQLGSLANSAAALLLPWEELEQTNSTHEYSLAQIEAEVQYIRQYIPDRADELAAWLGTQPGEAAHVEVALQPASIIADGTSTSTAIATVTDAGGMPIPGESLSFSSTDPGEQIGPVADNGDGTYSVPITSSTVAGAATILATDASGAPTVAGSAVLTQRSEVSSGDPKSDPTDTKSTPAAPKTSLAVTITGGPSKRTRDRRPTFRFTSDDRGASFRCKLDDRPYRSCGSPDTVSRLALGQHVFHVRAVSTAGEAGPAASYGFFVGRHRTHRG
jgi:spore coat protein CotH